MIKKTLIAACCASAMALGSTANAAFFDFEGEANTSGEGGYLSYNLTNDGITVTATAAALADPTVSYYAYLDADPWPASGAGLGVCKSLDGAGYCTPSTDDNVTDGEVLKLSFSQEVTIQGISFFNGQHEAVFNGQQFNVSIDGGAAVSYNLVANFASNLTGTTFDFWLVDQTPTTDKTNKFYISALTAVPAPAPLLLGALGLIGVAAASRRKKSA